MFEAGSDVKSFRGKKIPPIRSGLASEFAAQEEKSAESHAAVARLELAIARIEGYLFELERTFAQTNDEDVAHTIEQRTRQLTELQENLRRAQNEDQTVSRRESSLASIFEPDPSQEREPLPAAFAHVRATFFSDLLHPSRSNSFLRAEWLENPRIREAMLEHLTEHVPSFLLIQEELIRACAERYPTWEASDCAAYTRRVLPTYLEHLAKEIDATAYAIEQHDPKADVAPAYEQAAELLLRRFDRFISPGTDGRVLWAPLHQLNTSDEPFYRLLEHHQHASAPLRTRERLVERFEALVQEAVSLGEESAGLARDVIRHYNKLIPLRTSRDAAAS